MVHVVIARSFDEAFEHALATGRKTDDIVPVTIYAPTLLPDDADEKFAQRFAGIEITPGAMRHQRLMPALEALVELLKPRLRSIEFKSIEFKTSHETLVTELFGVQP